MATTPLDLRKISRTMPSEMALEINILRYLANCLECKHGLAEGDVTLTSPTQNEEHDLGFDAMAGLPSGRYIVLQFKRPCARPCKQGAGHADFKISGHQAAVLTWYPSGSAFYALPNVCTNKDMWKARTCLLDKTCIVDARHFFCAFGHSSIAQMAASGAGRSNNGQKKSAVRDPVRAARIDNKAKINVRPRGPACFCTVPSANARSLCSDPANIGFVVKNGKVMTRQYKNWNYNEWLCDRSHGKVDDRSGRPVEKHPDEARPPLSEPHILEWAEWIWSKKARNALRRRKNDSGRDGNAYVMGLPIRNP